MNDPTTTPLKQAGVQVLPQGWDTTAQSGNGDWSVNKNTNGETHVRIPDGSDFALGATTDSAASSDTANVGLVALMKRLLQKWTAGLTVSGTVTANIGTTNGVALDGTDATGVTPPTGAVGIRGWLSAIYNLFNGGTAKVTVQPSTNNIGDVDVLTLPAVTQGTGGTSPWAVSRYADKVNMGTLLNAVTVNGSSALFDVSGMSTCAFGVTGTFVATVTFEGTIDDSTWFPILATQVGGGVIASSTTTTGLFRSVVAGLKSVRATVSNYVSGSVTVNARATTSEAPSKVTMSADKMTPLVTVPMDFSRPNAKTAGQTYDVPHVEKRAGNSSFLSPSSFSTEATTAQYLVRSVLDGTTDATVLTSVNGQYALELFSFDLLSDLRNRGYIPSSWDATKLKAALRSITVSWVGYGVGANASAATNGATVKIWNTSGTPAWDATAVGTNTATAPSTVTKTYTANANTLANYLDANGILNILAHSTYASDGTLPSTIYTDYISLTVQLANEMLPVRAEMRGVDGDGAQRTAKVTRQGEQVIGNVVEQVLYSLMDYRHPVAKTSGQTWDNPHVFKGKVNSPTFDAPSTFTGEASTSSYAQVSTQGDSSIASTSTSVAGNSAQELFSFDLWTTARRLLRKDISVAELQSALQSIVVTWVGYGVGSNGGVSTNGATVKAWNGSSWVLMASNTASSPQSFSWPTSNSVYVDSNGFFHALAHSTYPSDGSIASTVYTDYVKCEMYLKGDMLAEPIMQAMGRSGNVAPVQTLQVGGKDTNGNLQSVGVVTSAADAQALALNRQATSAVTMLYDGATLQMSRAATKSVRVTFSGATSVTLATPGTGKKINSFHVEGVGWTANTVVDLKDGATTIRSRAADANGNVTFDWPTGGTSGRSAAANNTYSLSWTGSMSGSASIQYCEE